MDLILLAQFGVATFLCGLIWTIQVVHYPAFSFVARDIWSLFHPFHCRRIGYIVMPVMLSEVALMLGGFLHHGLGGDWRYGLAAACVVGVWAITGLVQVRQHSQLAEGRDAALIHRLEAFNWPRTLLWTLRTLLLGWILLAPEAFARTIEG